MTPDEKNLIAGLFGRLKDADAGAGPKDREAETFIAQGVTALPSAPYLLVQTVLVQEHALANAQAKIAELEKELAAAKSTQPAGSGSFLGGLADKLGPWGRRGDQPAAPQPATPAPQPAPTPYPPQPMAPQPGYAGYASTAEMAPSAGGGFLRSALTTAAGVAGGALLFQGIQGLLGHNAGAFGPGLGGGYGGAGWGGGGTTVNETVNNYYGNDPSSGAIPADDQQGADRGYQQDAGYQDVDTSDTTSDDSGDFGGGSDDAI
jgi:hypothetical protein